MPGALSLDVLGLVPPSRLAGLPVEVRQVKSASASGNVVLNSTPNQGSVILFGLGTASTSVPSNPTGGGATWTHVGRVIATTSQMTCDLWVGVVGSSPSATLNWTFLGAGNSYAAEISKGLTGRIMNGSSATSGNGTTLGLFPAALNNYPDPFPCANLGAFVVWYVARFAPGTLYPEQAWTWDPGVVSSNVRYVMKIRPFQFNKPVAFSAPTGNASNHCCVQAAIC